jgi:hypothetical protein
VSTEGQSTIAVKETTIDPGSSRCFPRWWCTGSFRGEGRPTIFRKESSSMSKIRSMFRVFQTIGMDVRLDSYQQGILSTVVQSDEDHVRPHHPPSR